MTADATNRDLRLAIWTTLHSAACQRVDFRHRGCAVDGQAYRAVALAAWNGLVDVRRRAFGSGGGSAAQYDDDGNALYHETGFLALGAASGTPLEAARFAADQATCVHELTHAIHDARNLGKRPGEESEVIAYVAESLFRLYAGYPLSTETAIVRAAGAVARFVSGWPGVELGEGMVGELRRAILAAPLYADLTRHGCWSNGIPNLHLD